MALASQTYLPTPTSEENDVLERVFEGYRFSVCTDAETAGRALDVRREVYVAGKGYGVPVPVATSLSREALERSRADVERAIDALTRRLDAAVHARP